MNSESPQNAARAQERAPVRLLSQHELPMELRRIPSPPDSLYLWGNLDPPPVCRIAVVGARRSTALGQRVAYRLGYELASKGIQIVSGLARGVDSAVLEGALAGGGNPGAVLGNGFPEIYPPENRSLAERMANRGGFLITELAFGAPPASKNFPRRNRLISGLAAAVVVVEAGLRSGSIHTAHWALEQGKDVFVFPGPADTPNFAGNHKLIRDGARLITGAEDLLQDLAWPAQEGGKPCESATGTSA